MAFYDVNSDSNGDKPVLAHTSSGDAIVAYRNNNSGTYEVVACLKTNEGGSFSCTTIDTNTGYPSIYCNFDDTNTVLLVYPKKVGDIYELYFTTSSDEGVTWASPQHITANSTYDNLNPNCLIDSKGNMVVAYESRDSELIERIYVMYKIAGATDWQGPVAITPTTTTTVATTTTILNGDFENWTSGDADDWIVLGTAVDTEETTIVKNGTSSMQLVGGTDDTSNGAYQTVTPETTSTAGANRFLLRGWMYAASGTAHVDIRTPHGEVVINSTTDTGRWEPWSVIFSTVNNQLTASIRLYAASASDTTYYDNFELVRLSSNTYKQHTPCLSIDSDDITEGHINVMYTHEDNAGGYEIRFSSSTLEGGTNITDDIRSLRVSRDKEFRTGTYGAGDFSIVLDNTSQLYNNESVTSPFYKRLKSGLEVTIETGVRAYSGTGSLYDEEQWSTELYPSIVGIASKFALNARNNTLTISGRDRADRFMSYRNFTSELYETQTALEIIENLANSDADGDGFGDIDVNRPFIDLSLGAKQQTLTAWDDKLISSQGTSTGDAGSTTLTKTIQKTIDVDTYQSGVAACIGAWIDRSDSEEPLYLIGTISTGGGLEEAMLHKYTGWKNASSTLSHDASWDILSQFDETVYLTGGVMSVSPYDAYHDCVWIQYAERNAGETAYVLKIYHFDFKTQTATNKLTVETTANIIDYTMTAGAVFYDSNNSKIWFSNTYARNMSGGGTGWPRYGVCSVGGTQSNPTLTLDFFDDLQDEQEGTAATGEPETYFPSVGINLGPYNYMILGFQVEASGTVVNYSSFGAIKSSIMNAHSQTMISNFPVNTALCWVTHPVGASPASGWSDTYKALATGEAFFDLSTSQQVATLSIDYDDDFVYVFTSDDNTNDWEFKNIDTSIQVRRLASRTYDLSRTNIQTSQHTEANGYIDDDTDYVWFSTEEVNVENLANTPAADLNEEDEYVDNEWTLSGTGILTVSGTGLVFSDVPSDDYEIHLETGEIKFTPLFDKDNSIFASYDYKHAAPYAWFEDTSIWDAIQEVSSSGDFVCYVNESGQLVFKDRFIYHQPLAQTYAATLQANGLWSGTPFQLENLDGTNVTNIIPGLEFVSSSDPDKDTGVFTNFKRRSYTIDGTTTVGEEGDYDIDYDTGEIGFNTTSTGNIKDEERPLIYYYNRNYVFEYAYDSNVIDLTYEWGADSIANRITVKGERYFPSISPIKIREVFVVNPGDTVISTKFANIKQLDTSGGSINQNQFDAFANQWRQQASDHSIDLEFRNPLIGDTARARNAGNAIKVRAIPTTSPAAWDEDSSAFETIPNSEWVGIGWKVNWDSFGDTGAIANPNIAGQEELNITNLYVDSDGIRVEIDHLEKSQRQFFIQLEVEGYTLTRTQRFTALHENYASMQKYYTRSFELTNRFISNIDIAKNRARLLSRFLSEERPEVRITVTGSPFIELEDVVVVREVNSGLAGDYFEVVGISDEILQDTYVTNLRLRKIAEVTTNALSQNDPVAGYAGGYIGKTALPIETFINTDYNPI